MTNQPNEAARAEAARTAARSLFQAIAAMEDTEAVDLKLSSLEAIKGTNSRDSSFLDYLARGEHLTTGLFLAHAR